MKKYRNIWVTERMAEPMTRTEAIKKYGEGVVNGDMQEEGYIIQNYNSVIWMSKDSFEESYEPCETILDRLRLEYAELKERLFKLINFIMSEEFRELPKKKQVDLAMQRKAMSHYLGVLAVRIDGEKAEEGWQKAKEEEEPVQCKGMIDDLLGCMIVAAGKCDHCPNEQTDCKKLVLADGSHICCVRQDMNICDDGRQANKIKFTE
jgi:hypothetical protein